MGIGATLGMSGEIIRRAVLERYERSAHERRVDDAAGRMVARWGDVLDRLGSA